jgi:putative component of toxin-antitoxin plasmid stabilization module
VYEIELTEAFSVWFESLKDARAKGRIEARIECAGMEI